ncbi:MAG: NAD(P)/FAD-dependent oxidoreductase [Saprospiraceae bacterium]|nr:NAD(P)/FAD-dependent oxidoreductase [Saprospiraceae bacterium]
MAVDFQQLIVGAGFSGLGAAIRLQQSGRSNFMIFEKADRIGGTWRDNVYPGCACDVPSHLYSFSFAQNPNWSRVFSRQPEILAYMETCVDRFNLREKIQLNTGIKALRFRETEGTWLVETEQGETFTARTVLLGLGPLNVPKIPDIPGQDSFSGVQFHTAQWRQDHDLQNKRVAIIGTGASAVQIIPEIAQKVQKLYIFQRTPPWVGPRPDAAVHSFVQGLFQRFPSLLWLPRTLIYRYLEFRGRGLFGNKSAHLSMQKRALKHIRDSIADPVLREKVTPQYQIGCKRILLSEDYYPALQLPNVELITEAVTAIEGHTIIGAKGTGREIDTLIYATGFDAASYEKGLVIQGRNEQLLSNSWAKAGPEAYLGTTINGFPNLFSIIGPNTGLGHNSMIHMMESQYNYILSYLDLLEQQDARYLDVKADRQMAYNEEIQAQLADMVWSSGCNSWYQMDSGKNTTLWPGPTTTYRQKTRKVEVEDYQIVEKSATPDALSRA